MVEMETQYYYSSDGNTQKGPFSLLELKDLPLDKGTLIWRRGMKDWAHIEDIDELKGFLGDSPTRNNEVDEDEETIGAGIISETAVYKQKGFIDYFKFSGRASRKEFVLINLLIFIGLALLILITMSIGSDSAITIGAILSVFLFIEPHIAVLNRRLHDMDYPSWAILLIFVPVLRTVLYFTAFFGKGKE